MSVADLRKEYKLAVLSEGTASSDPIAQFERWFREALAAELPEPNAMTLATVSANARPSARVVLLKGFDQRGFSFFTNYESRKGGELAQTPWASLVVHWVELARQVRIEGRAEKVSLEESDSYFQTRPLLSRISAWASPQSRAIASRDWLEQAFAAAQQRFATQVPRPEHWGGYRVSPDAIEFWQGRENRLHDRLRYCLKADRSWRVERLAP
jgi:pyridoxamine 5'-phosphate oxidase